LIASGAAPLRAVKRALEGLRPELARTGTPEGFVPDNVVVKVEPAPVVAGGTENEALAPP